MSDLVMDTAQTAAYREVEELLSATTEVQLPIRSSSTVRHASQRELLGAMATWMGGTFVLCYMVLPLLTEYLGLFRGLIWNLGGNALAFAITLSATLVCVWLRAPKVAVRPGWRGPTDPVIAATSGGLLVWALLHNLIPWLAPFSSMAPAELSTFLIMNILESGLFGLMLASFASSRLSAFGLGGAFQTLFIGVTSVVLLLI